MKQIVLLLSLTLWMPYAYAQSADQLQQAHQFCQANFRQGNHYTLPECNKIDKKMSSEGSSHAAQQIVKPTPPHTIPAGIASRAARIAADQRAKSAADSEKFIKDMSK